MIPDRLPDPLREALGDWSRDTPRRSAREARRRLLAAARAPQEGARRWPVLLGLGAIVAVSLLLLAPPWPDSGRPPSRASADSQDRPASSPTQFVHVLSSGTTVVYVPSTRTREVLR